MSENGENKEKKQKLHRTSIGGQAVMEGVMMMGPNLIATSVRKSDGEIVTDIKPVGAAVKSKILRLPIIRGCVNFFRSMVIGVQSLMFSAQFFDDEEAPADEEPSKIDKWLEEHVGDEKAVQIAIYIAVVLSLALSVGLFMILPNLVVSAIKAFGIESAVVLNLCEGVIRIVIFLAYLLLVSMTKDIKRVFMYHGAEHKSIHCYEKGEELTVENVRAKSRLHPRCGTSFLLIVVVISIIAFSFLSWEVAWYARVGMRLLLLPVVAGVSYEILKLVGRHDNAFTKVVRKPGLWLQYITTREPDDSQIEVAVTSLKAVIPENKDEDKW